MSFLKLIYIEVFYRPVLNGLLFLTTILPVHDLGLAVILLTVLIKILIFPLTHKMVKTQKAMRDIEPDVKKIYAEKKTKEEQSRAVMELYKAHGINPFSGFLSLLVQFPLLFAMYQVFWKGIPFQVGEIYSFLQIPAEMNTMFLGFISLTDPNMGLSAFAAISQFWQAKLAMPATPTQGQGKGDPPDRQAGMGRMMQLQMLYMFPVLIFFLGFKLPAAVSLYWTAMNVFAIVHEAMVRRSANKQSGGKSKVA